MKKQRSKRTYWFYKVRGSYLPVSWQGWVLYVPYIAFLYVSLQYALSSRTTPADVFFVVFPQWVAAAAVMTWLATIHSK
jgi:hypothetical protein